MPLDRFLDAQKDAYAGFETALGELTSGRKRSHWVWYIFPQLAGLGSSPMAVQYGLRGIPEADAYLRHPILRARLALAAAAAAAHLGPGGSTLHLVMGSHIDVLKLVSSMTLFGAVATRLGTTDSDPQLGRLLSAASTILDAAARERIPPCAFTRAVLAGAQRG
jgi:uncharacterized protein (DUF1810 family)